MASNSNVGKILGIIGVTAAVGVGLYFVLRPKTTKADLKKTAKEIADAKKRLEDLQKSGTQSPASKSEESDVKKLLADLLKKQDEQKKSAPAPAPSGGGGGGNKGGGSGKDGAAYNSEYAYGTYGEYSGEYSSEYSGSDYTPSDYTPSDYTPSDYTPSDYTPSDYTPSGSYD